MSEKQHQAPDVGDYTIGCDGAPLCTCGDPRSDHPNDGPCKLNGLGHGLPSDEPANKCMSYRASAVKRSLNNATRFT